MILDAMTDIQLQKMNMVPLVNKPYANGVTVRKQNLSKIYCQSFESEVCLEDSLDLSNEVLLVSLGQRAATLQAVKL